MSVRVCLGGRVTVGRRVCGCVCVSHSCQILECQPSFPLDAAAVPDGAVERAVPEITYSFTCVSRITKLAPA